MIWRIFIFIIFAQKKNTFALSLLFNNHLIDNKFNELIINFSNENSKLHCSTFSSGSVFRISRIFDNVFDMCGTIFNHFHFWQIRLFLVHTIRLFNISSYCDYFSVRNNGCFHPVHLDYERKPRGNNFVYNHFHSDDNSRNHPILGTLLRKRMENNPIMHYLHNCVFWCNDLY